VQSGSADFTAILVYDVSRWGRFQDADESAYYKYICKRAGIQVVYCAEQFENDGSPVSTIVKGVKRAMAGEYSRELSAKVFKGQCKLIELGFRQGGPAGYGLRRMLVDQNGEPKGELKLGEQKSLQTDRVILVPGPANEVETVRRVYRLFLQERLNEQAIADALNQDGVPTERGGRWTRASVHQLLINEKYVGHNVYNRVSFKWKKKRVRNPPSMWVRHDDAFEAVVPDVVLDQLLAWVGAHVLVLARHDHAGESRGVLGHRLHVHDARDVRPAMTDVHADAGGPVRPGVTHGQALLRGGRRPGRATRRGAACRGPRRRSRRPCP